MPDNNDPKSRESAAVQAFKSLLLFGLTALFLTAWGCVKAAQWLSLHLFYDGDRKAQQRYRAGY